MRPSLNEISRRGASRRLRRQLMDLLVLLADRAGRVVSREEILQEIWKRRFVAETVLHRSIAELRDSLDDDREHPVFIETIPKRGYRLVAPVLNSTAALVKTRQPSVLVLPFRDLSEKGDQQYFCDGLAEQIINALARVRGLRVIARSSAFRVRREAADLSEIKKLVNVDLVLEGSVRKAGDQIRITVELIDVAGECYMWSECYDRTAGSILDLQGEIALGIVEKLRVELLAHERNGVVKRHTEDVEAHTSYLKGLYYWNQRTREGTRLSRQCFEQAIQQDPGYALPYVALANSYSIAAFYGLAPAGKCFPEARRLAGRALEIDPGLGESQAALGFIAFLYDWDWPASEACFKQALALNPNYSTAYAWYALCLSWAGQPERAADTLERAYVSDPLSPLLATTRGVLLYQQEQYEPACRQFRQVLEVDSDYTLAHAHLSRTLIALGEYDQAVAHATKAAIGLPVALLWAGFAHARAGRRAEAGAILSQVLEAFGKDCFSPVLIGYLYLALHDSERALHWFAEARRLRDPLLPQVRSDPLASEVHSAAEVLTMSPAPERG